MYLFKSHLPGQDFIPVEAESEEQAYWSLLRTLKAIYPDEDIYKYIKSKINKFPILEQDYFQNVAVESWLEVPSRRITLRS